MFFKKTLKINVDLIVQKKQQDSFFLSMQSIKFHRIRPIENITEFFVYSKNNSAVRNFSVMK